MTVSSTNTKRQFNGDGSTAAFAYNFKVFADADLQVIVRSATGTESVKTSGSHYNASGIGETSGGTVTFTSGNIPASGETITLRRAKTIAQELSLVANDPFPAANLNDQLDKMTHLILQNNEELDRALKLSRTNTMTSTEFAQSATDRASKVLSFDSSGEIAVTQELGTFRGNWAASTAYNERDIIRDNSATGNQSIYIVITAHTSSGSLPITTNTDAAKFSAIIDNTTATTTTNVTSITNDALVVGRDADNQLKFSTDNQIIFRVGAGDGVTFKGSGEIEATSLDISGDADIDGTLEADAITIGGVTLAETIADTVGAMVSSNTESGIAVTYDDSDNTLDFTVASITAVGALNSGSITSGFGAIDNGSSAITTTGTITAGTFVLGTASLNENDLESIDGITAGTAAASKALILDANLDNSGARNITISGELDAATLDISGNADIDGTLEADAITLGGTALGSLYSPIAGSSSIVTTGALNSGSITSGFGTIDTGSSTITTTGDITGGTFAATSAIGAGDNASVGYSSTDGLLLIGQGSTNDVSLLNDTGAVVARIPTGGTTFVVSGALQTTGAAGAKLFLTTAEATVVANDSLGAIEFYATSETAPDGNSKAGAIECTAEGTFAGDNNATQMLFKLGVSEAASTKMTLSSGGNLTVTGVGTFASLDISGDIDVDGTTNLDVVDIDGAANFAADVTFADGADIITASAGTSNFRAGVNAGNSIASGGNFNVVVGDEAGTAITTGDNNTAIGFEALSTEDADGNNTAIGYQALKTLNAGASGFNTAVGVASGTAMTTGVKNTLLGHGSGAALTNADFNIAIGFGSLNSDTLGSKSVAIGEQTLNAQNFTTATDAFNTAVGHNAGKAVSTGIENTLIGSLAGDALTDADFNVAVGKQTLTADTLGSRSTAIGFGALQAQNFTSATDTYNVALGFWAGKEVTTGDQNTLIGASAGDALTTGNKNTVLGYNALGGGTTYDGNTAIGHEALKVANITTGADANNTAVGVSAGVAVTTGLKNVIIGVSAAGTLTTGSDNICIGRQADVNAGAALNQITIGIDIDAGGDNNFSFGKASNVVTNDFDADANWSRSSDKRKKREIYDQELGLDFVNDLRTVNFQWKPSNEFPKEWNDYSENNNMDTDVVMHGFIAQEVKEVLDKHSSERDSNFSGWKEGEDGMQHTSREMFVIPLIKAVQELSAQVDTLKEEIKELKNG